MDGFLYCSAPGHPQCTEVVAKAVVVGWGSALCLLGGLTTVNPRRGWRQDTGCVDAHLARHLPVLTHCSRSKGKVL